MELPPDNPFGLRRGFMESAPIPAPMGSMSYPAFDQVSPVPQYGVRREQLAYYHQTHETAMQYGPTTDIRTQYYQSQPMGVPSAMTIPSSNYHYSAQPLSMAQQMMGGPPINYGQPLSAPMGPSQHTGVEYQPMQGQTNPSQHPSTEYQPMRLPSTAFQPFLPQQNIAEPPPPYHASSFMAQQGRIPQPSAENLPSLIPKRPSDQEGVPTKPPAAPTLAPSELPKRNKRGRPSNKEMARRAAVVRATEAHTENVRQQTLLALGPMARAPTLSPASTSASASTLTLAPTLAPAPEFTSAPVLAPAPAPRLQPTKPPGSPLSSPPGLTLASTPEPTSATEPATPPPPASPVLLPIQIARTPVTRRMAMASSETSVGDTEYVEFRDMATMIRRIERLRARREIEESWDEVASLREAEADLREMLNGLI